MLGWLAAMALAGAQEAPTGAQAAEPAPRMRYEVGFRARYVTIPSGTLDAWFTDVSTPGWPVDGDRPTPSAVAYGIEFLFGPKRSSGRIYLEVMQSLMPEGLWDDTDEPANDFRDAEWIRPAPFFGAVILGFNGEHAVPIVRLDQTQGKVTLDFVVGGGLGIAILVGSLETWQYSYDTGRTAWEQLEVGDPPAGYVDLKSPVWPVPDLNLGFKLGFVDRAWIRFEGGLHGGLFGGGSVGARF